MQPGPPHDPPQKVLVYHIGSLGDTLIALPALWALRAAWPQSSFWLTTKHTAHRHVVVADAIFEGSGLFDGVIEYPGTRHGGDGLGLRLRQAALLFALRRARFDAVVYLAPSERRPEQVARDERFFRFAGIRQRIGFADFPPPPGRGSRPLPTLAGEAEMLLERLRRAGLPMPAIGDARLDCAVGPDDLAAVGHWVDGQSGADRGRPWLALAPGSNMPAKIWPLERYAEVARRLIDEFDLWPVVFGGPEDRDAGSALCEQVGCGWVAAGALPLRVAAAAMRGCVLYLGNDTGTMHLAASEGVPCVAPFSARDFPGKWHPVGDRHVVIRRRPACEGCMLERCETEAMRCLLDIGVDEVWQAARALLRAGAAAERRRLGVAAFAA